MTEAALQRRDGRRPGRPGRLASPRWAVRASAESWVRIALLRRADQGRRVHPEVLGQPRSQRGQGGERVGLAGAGVLRPGEQRPELLAVGMVGSSRASSRTAAAGCPSVSSASAATSWTVTWSSVEPGGLRPQRRRLALGVRLTRPELVGAGAEDEPVDGAIERPVPAPPGPRRSRRPRRRALPRGGSQPAWSARRTGPNVSGSSRERSRETATCTAGRPASVGPDLVEDPLDRQGPTACGERAGRTARVHGDASRGSPSTAISPSTRYAGPVLVAAMLSVLRPDRRGARSSATRVGGPAGVPRTARSATGAARSPARAVRRTRWCRGPGRSPRPGCRARRARGSSSPGRSSVITAAQRAISRRARQYR